MKILQLNFLTKLEIEFYEDLQLVETNGKEYVLFDTSSEFFDDWGFPGEITTLHIPLEDFIYIKSDLVVIYKSKINI